LAQLLVGSRREKEGKKRTKAEEGRGKIKEKKNNVKMKEKMNSTAASLGRLHHDAR
jgi:hypothetical protein